MNAVAPENDPGGQNEQQVGADHFIHSIMRVILIFTFFQLFSQNLGIIPQPHPSAVGSESNGYEKMKPQGASTPKDGMLSYKPSCIWDPGTTMDLRVYVTDVELIDPLEDCPQFRNAKNLLTEWHESKLVLSKMKKTNSDINNGRQANITFTIPEDVKFNHTHIYAHVCLMRRLNQPENPQKMQKDDILLKTISLTKYKRRKRLRDEKKLLDSPPSLDGRVQDSEAIALRSKKDSSPLTVASANTTHEQILLYLKPSLTLQLIDPYSMPYFPNRKSIPNTIKKHIQWKSEKSNTFYPILYFNEFWMTRESLTEVNDTLTEPVTLTARFENSNMWKWQLMSQMEDSWKLQEELNGGDDDGGTDMLRTMFLETNPYLLVITLIVSVLHTIFDVLAFKNDIKFFKGNKSMEGLSLRSMVVNTASQLIIFLYLMDNETSFMVLMSNGVGIAIECWKITKAVDISLLGDNGRFKLQWEEKNSYKESKTKEYDKVATSHLLHITTPLVLGCALYSLMNQKHKGWYSWILNTLVGFIYMFGFVMMTPQLFINYKLQSVAHLNWRTLTYKSINTFIDDLFAFVIKMPIMHRLACLRDDAIFLIFCYQRYKYRTDYTRVNEYGQCEQPTEEVLREQKEEEEHQQHISFVHDNKYSNEGGINQTPKRRAAGEKQVAWMQKK